ncbi:CoxG family protein [Neobacillus sp. D3-1R]|uniref:CoxG family protein n=1 Tax=Neobacillus sp. D3-1R TaxID=3445778 RepID=UPI003FA0C1B8
MKFEYVYTIGLPRNLVWKWLKNEKVLQKSITGCKMFEQTANGVYHAEINVQLGPLNDVFNLEIRRIKENMPSYYHVKGKGKIGEIHGKAELLLNESQGATKLSMNADIELTGSVALAANQLIEGKANRSIDKFMQRLEKEIKKGIHQSRRSGR